LVNSFSEITLIKNYHYFDILDLTIYAIVLNLGQEIV